MTGGGVERVRLETLGIIHAWFEELGAVLLQGKNEFGGGGSREAHFFDISVGLDIAVAMRMEIPRGFCCCGFGALLCSF